MVANMGQHGNAFGHQFLVDLGYGPEPDRSDLVIALTGSCVRNIIQALRATVDTVACKPEGPGTGILGVACGGSTDPPMPLPFPLPRDMPASALAFRLTAPPRPPRPPWGAEP